MMLSRMTPHPLLERVAMLPSLLGRELTLAKKPGQARAKHKDAAEEMAIEFAALVESIRAHGVREPLKVCSVGDGGPGLYIVDGRHRWMAAQAAGLESVPTVLVDEADARDVILDANTRRHLTKSATAYMAVLMFPEVIESQRGNPQLGTECLIGNSQLSSETTIGQTALAQRVGVAPRLVRQAVELFRLFYEYPNARDVFEPNIWTGSGLGNLIAVAKEYIERGTDPEADKSADQRAAEAAARAIALARSEVARMRLTWNRWETLSAVGRETINNELIAVINAAPDEVRQALAASLKTGLTA